MMKVVGREGIRLSLKKKSTLSPEVAEEEEPQLFSCRVRIGQLVGVPSDDGRPCTLLRQCKTVTVDWVMRDGQ